MALTLFDAVDALLAVVELCIDAELEDELDDERDEELDDEENESISVDDIEGILLDCIAPLLTALNAANEPCSSLKGRKLGTGKLGAEGKFNNGLVCKDPF